MVIPEILLYIIFAPICSLLLEAPLDDLEQSLLGKGISKRKRALIILLMIFVGIVLIAGVLAIIFGAYFLAKGTDEEKNMGLILLLVGLGVIIAYVVLVVIRLNLKGRRKRKKRKKTPAVRPDRTALRRIVHVVVDRPLGSTHPNHADIVYDVNYGFVPGVMGGDGEEQDAYIIGVETPVSEFDGVVVGILHRTDDVEDKLVVAPRGYEPTDDEIIEKTAFQEKYFKSELIR